MFNHPRPNSITGACYKYFRFAWIGFQWLELDKEFPIICVAELLRKDLDNRFGLFY